MGEQLSERRSRTTLRVQELRNQLQAAEARITGKACVYATGSFGRCEAGNHTDLDLFIVGKRDGKPGRDGKEGSLLSRLDEICIKADLIQVTRHLGIPEFSGDGQYLEHYSVHELTKALGTPEDDATNTFTARLLLLLESCPLLGEAVYDEIAGEVIQAYWRDYADHTTDFMPAFLANDILRLWRTFCVNYEARTEREPEEKKAKRKLKNYKLKHSRLLTCYSALLYLLAVHDREKTVTPEYALQMVKLTPTERLELISGHSDSERVKDLIATLLAQYDSFLQTTNIAEGELTNRFLQKNSSQTYMTAAYDFGNSMFETLNCIGKNSQFHRLLVV